MLPPPELATMQERLKKEVKIQISVLLVSESVSCQEILCQKKFFWQRNTFLGLVQRWQWIMFEIKASARFLYSLKWYKAP
jgi:hypothetical protein